MESNFKRAYAELNQAQRSAVDKIDGPLLVVAGPGTGKTQLLSIRVANILRQTDVNPANIICLTFTDNAARNMRERLQGIIGQAAYHVAIHTFHSFGSDIINKFPEHFSNRQMLQQVDELGRYELLKDIFEDLPHSNPLSAKVGDDFVFLKDTLDVISWLKQNALTPSELKKLLSKNQIAIDKLAKPIAETFQSTPSPKDLPSYNKLLKTIKSLESEGLYGFLDYALVMASELEAAIAETPASGRYAKPITAWRSRWCVKNTEGEHVLKDGGRNLYKLLAVSEVYEKLLQRMSELGLYDFDDMITETVHALETGSELRFTLQEQYQYVLVDEFQDTNKAQLRMLNALGNNPVYEGKPNIMVVGDDNQAIYSFQGAEASNMLAFAREYKIDKPIVLTDNYRSTPEILEASFAVADQISDRLDVQFEGTHKDLIAQVKHKTNTLEHNVFASELAQYDWIAEQTERYIKSGLRPEQIAVIAPRHRYLERLMPYLGSRKIPVAYERRENILESPIILQLLAMTRLVVALNANKQNEVDALFAEVLSYDFWRLPDEILIQISLEAYEKHKHWLEILSKHKDANIRQITEWFTGLAKRSQLEPLEYILDKLVGGISEGVDSEYDELVSPEKSQAGFVSPFRDFYFSPQRYDKTADVYLALLGQLSTLRQRLRQWKPMQALYAKDLIEFADLHASAGLKIIDSNPHTQTTNAVQVMTAYKAKGLEFEVVFVINAQDEVWGPLSRSRSSSISLPKNLPIEPASGGDNDKLRLFFVALTRAKHTLLITGYSHTLENKLSNTLSFLIDEQDEPIQAGFIAKQIDQPASDSAVAILTTDWAYRFRQVIADKASLFEPILADYKLSVTHLNNFLDVVSGGPQYFLTHNLLRFPEAPTPSAAYGDAVHKTLQWMHLELRQNGQLPSEQATADYFLNLMSRKQLRSSDLKRLEGRGKAALKYYVEKRSQDLKASDILERGFNNEGVVINGANLSGKIDKLRIAEGTAEVIDFKTGKPALNWQGKDEYEKVKLHKYKQQLLFYKLLVEHSASYTGKLKVTKGALEFIETNEQGKLVDNLALEFSEQELERFVKLVSAVWQHIISLNFPDVSKYPSTLNGVIKFEDDLISGTI